MRVKDLLGVALIAMTVSAAGAGVVFFRTSQRLDLDSSFCPKTGPAGWSTIIIDRTDPLQPSEQEMVRKLVEEERKSLPRAAKLTVVVLREEKSRNKVEATTLMALCNPGADNQVSVLFENTRKAALRYETAFRAPLDAALATLDQEGSAPSSPIAATVAAALADFGAAGRRKLILVSDLLEHTAEASAYRGTFGVAVLAKVIPAEIAARFRGVEVQIVLLPRPGYIPQQKKAAGVWDEFLTSAMGHPPEWLRL